MTIIDQCDYKFPETGNQCVRLKGHNDARGHVWRKSDEHPIPPPIQTELTSLREIKSRLAAIEQREQEIFGAIRKFATQIYNVEQGQMANGDGIAFIRGELGIVTQAQSVLCERLDKLLQGQAALEKQPIVIQGIKEFVEAYNNYGPKEVIEQAKAFKEQNGKPKPRRKHPSGAGR